MTSFPGVFGLHSLPFSSSMATSTPKNGRVAVPGLMGVQPGRGDIMAAPVSVCHHVSTIGHLPPPIFSWYQSQAAGFIGSPTVPRSLSDERSCLSTCWSPALMNARMAVGAV